MDFNHRPPGVASLPCPVRPLLYMAPLAAGRDDLYNYVDDVAVYVSGRNYAEAKEALRREHLKVKRWVEAEGLSLNPSKTEVVFFRH